MTFADLLSLGAGAMQNADDRSTLIADSARRSAEFCKIGVINQSLLASCPQPGPDWPTGAVNRRDCDRADFSLIISLSPPAFSLSFYFPRRALAESD